MKKEKIPIIILILISLPFVKANAQQTHFSFIGAVWGTSLNPVEAEPGDLNVPLTISVQYFGYYVATSIHAELVVSNEFSNAIDENEPKAVAVNIAPNSIFTLTYYLNIAPNASVGKYILPLRIMWNTTWEYNMIEEINVTLNLKGKVKLNFQSENLYLESGKFNDVAIIVKNYGTGEAKNLNINIGGPAQTIILENSKTVDKLEPNSEISFRIKVFVAANLANQPISLALTGNYKDPYSNLKSFTQNIGFIVKPIKAAEFRIATKETYLKVGEVNTVRISVENFGDTTLNNITIGITSSPPLNLIESDGKIFLGTLKVNERLDTSLKLYVTPTSQTTSTLTLTITYYDTAGNLKSENRYVTFLLNATTKVSPISIKVNPTTLIAGKINSIEITLTNERTTIVKDVSVTFSFTTSQITWLTPDIFQTEKILPGESIVIKAKAYNPPTSITSTILQAIVKYYDESGTFYQESRNIGMLSQGIIELKTVDIATLPEQPAPGQIFSATITITNVGTIAASSVTAVPQLPEGFRMFGSKSVFIGDVQVNTPTTFTLSIQALNRTKPQTYQIPIIITYYDNLRNQHNMTLNLTINIQEKNITQTTTSRPNNIYLTSWTLPTILGIVLFVIGYIIGKRFKK
ncbi:MAG: hypothetical protein N3F64_03480 [Nitrososphaeria archaeon]|nr:hypothetical protein [Nitrososphaeria archaeon]